MKRMALALAAGLMAVPASAQVQEMPGWMSGCWQMREDSGRWAEECWTLVRGGQMMGSGRAGSGGDLGSFEFMLIRQDEDGAITFFAAPSGNNWTPFAAEAADGQSATFVNPDNDYPQKVRYWREGELLKARISMLDDSNPMEWTFARMGG